MSAIVEKKIKTSGHNMEVRAEFYESAMDVCHDCSRRTITDSSFKKMDEVNMGSFEGVKNYEEAMSLLRNGYQPTVAKLKEKLTVKDRSQKRISFQNNIVGGTPIVPLALRGVPNCMVDMKMKPIKCKVIDVYYDMTCSCGVNSDDIIKNGQKMLGAILDLERQGYRFNLYAIQTYSDFGSVDLLSVKIKSSNQPLDLRRMSFPLTHTAFFRVIGFDWYSKFPKGKYRFGYGHGIAYELNNNEMNEFSSKAFGDNSIYFAGSNILTQDEEYIKEVLKNAGNKNGNN